ncbi:hypothetical protein GCM10009540_11940 [Streptomyces turgidiscabies]
MGERWDVWVNERPARFPDGSSDAVMGGPVASGTCLTSGQASVCGGEIRGGWFLFAVGLHVVRLLARVRVNMRERNRERKSGGT